MNDSDIEDNNQPLNNVTIIQNTFVNTATIVSSSAVVIWTILANAAIIVCFVINRNKIWPNFSKQILSLSVCDICVGCAAVPFCIFAIHDVKVSYRVCAVVYCLFLASQSASLCHVFGICVHRLVVIHYSARLGESRTHVRMPLLLSVSAVILSLVVCSLPYLIYGQRDVEIQCCVLHEMFKDNLRKATRFIFIIYLVPQVLTNILYIIACFRLKCAGMKVFPDHPGSLDNTIETALRAHAFSQMNVSSDRAYNRTSIRMQQKIMGTIGALMLIFNICTVPLLLMLMMESEDQETKRNTRFLASTLFILNSALNPFVYALRTDWLKLALKKMFKDLFEIICLCKQ